MDEPLSGWKDSAAKDAILDFVARISEDGSPDAVPIADRVAVFDNDGTQWAEKPMPIQMDFCLRRLSEMAEADESLRDRQPWKAAHTRDYDWLASVLAEYYAGDDTKARILVGGFLAGSRTSASISLPPSR